MTRLVALEALDDLELSATPCHEPCHAKHRSPACLVHIGPGAVAYSICRCRWDDLACTANQLSGLI
jgi:hypothetical protein